jgi:dihydroxyacetone kinase-like predicted kinase
MGARGNSGVILSQILRGMCEGIDGADVLDTELLASSLERSVTVAFQAVRKPVEGTILTVFRDTAEAARAACRYRSAASRGAYDDERRSASTPFAARQSYCRS